MTLLRHLCGLAFTSALCAGPLTITSTSPLPTGGQGIPYNFYFSATSGSPPYTWTQIGGALPNGLMLGLSTGSLNGTPTAGGPTSNVTVQVTDMLGAMASASFAITITPPVAINNPSPLPNGTMGASYSQTFNANGGTAPYFWTLATAGGPLPSGLTLTTAGVLSGTPIATGTSNFLIQATDSNAGAQGLDTKSFSLTVNTPFAPVTIINATPLPPAILLVPYSQTMNGSGGMPPYAWSIVGGSAPGITLTQAGVLGGTPTATGTFDLVIQATDSGSQGYPGTKGFTLTVNAPPLGVPQPFLAPSTVGVAYSRTLQAIGGVPPYSWSIVSGSPPPGVTMTAAGVLSGTPTAAAMYTFNAKLSDSDRTPSTLTIPVQAFINPVLDFGATSPLPSGVEGIPYLFKFPGTGGTPPISGSVSAGALPPGLAVGSAGSIAGTPTTAGNYNFTLQATDGVGVVVSRAFAMAINPRMTITTASPLPAGTAGAAYSQNLTASGGAPPVVWSVASGTLPLGLTLSAAGALSGTPAAAAGVSFLAQASDAAGEVVTRQLVLNIAAALTIKTTTLSGGNVGVNYTRSLIATGGKPPYTWTLSSGALPVGVILATSGSLIGTPSAAGAFSFSVLLTDAAQVTATAPLTLTIAPRLTITSSSSLPDGRIGKPYSQTLAGSGGTPPYVWSVSGGALPPGLTLSGSSGVITGAPSAAGNFSFSAQIKDSADVLATAPLSLVIASPPVIGTASPLASAVTGTPYQQTLSASGGTPPYGWSLQAGALPGGLALDTQSGAIGGRPSAPGRAGFTVQVQDSGGATASKAFELTVTQTLQVSPATLVFRAGSAAQSIQIVCSTVGAPLSISTNSAWLQASAAHAVSPATVSIGSDPKGLAAGAYQGAVTIATGDTSKTVSVSLTVEASPAPPKFELSPGALDFTFARGSGASSQTISMTGPVIPPTVLAGAGWLSVAPPSGGTMVVTANPEGLAADAYTGRIQVGGAAVPVTMTISAAPQSIVLTQTGLTFTAVAGFSGTLSRSVGVLNTGQGSMNWTARSSVLSGGAGWLSATPASGSSESGARAAIIDVSVSPAGLAPGAYYGQVSVTAPSAGNSPQLVSVVLNLLPADQSPGAQVYPTGAIFIGVAGGSNPDLQSITLTNVAAGAATYTSTQSGDGGNWITLTPATGSVPGFSSSRITLQPNVAGLGPGVLQRAVTLRFGDGSLRTVNVALVLRSGTAAAASKAPTAAGCAPAKLVLLFTSVGTDFNIPAAWPSPIEMKIVDDCGDPLTAGSAVTTFSNGDPPLALTSLREGNWAGTWTPRGLSASGVAMTSQARNTGGNLQGSVRVSGAVRGNPIPPVINPNGVVNSASLAPMAPIAPGSLIGIFGSHLADAPLAAQALPLPTELGQTQVLIGAQELPLLFVSDGQINAVLPFEVAVNARLQVVVRRGTSYTTPVSVTLTQTEPAVFTRDQSGEGQGLVFDASFRFVDSANPATAGDIIVIYTTGLGEVTPPIPAGMPAPLDSLHPTAKPVTVTIGGVNAPQVLFAGLAPGFTGLYQVNVVVPEGVAPGDAVPVIISAADRPGPPVTMAVRVVLQTEQDPQSVFDFNHRIQRNAAAKAG